MQARDQLYMACLNGRKRNYSDCALVLIALGFSLLGTGDGKLLVRSVESGAVFPNPGNIVVGLTSDLTIEVQCAVENGTGTEVLVWYRNGVTVWSGLQAFGVSQGGNGNGILRVNPAQELLQPGGNQFVCSNNSGITLDVVFTPAEDLFFLSPPPSVTVPDIPALNVTRVEENGDLFYTVEGERGVYRSAPITTPEESLLSASVDGVPVANGVQELVVREGVSVQLDCSAPGLMVVNNEAMGSSSFQTENVTREQAGFYQCLTEDSVDSVYLLVTYMDPPMITQTDATPLFSCSSLGNPTPRLSWSIASQIPPYSPILQTPTGFGEPATSTVIDSSSVPEYIITCTSEVNVDGNPPLNASSTFNFTVFLEDIRIEGPDSIVLGDTVSVVCSARSNVVPYFSFAFSDVIMLMDNVASTGFQHQATLNIRDSSLYFTSETAFIGCNVHSVTLRRSAELFISVETSGTTSTAALIGGVVGGVLVLVLLFAGTIVICAVLWRQRRKVDSKSPPDYRLCGSSEAEEKGKLYI